MTENSTHPHKQYSISIGTQRRDTIELRLCDDLMGELIFLFLCKSLCKKSFYDIKIRIYKLNHTLATLHEKKSFLMSNSLVSEGSDEVDFGF
jgi:hypothetical protein